MEHYRELKETNKVTKSNVLIESAYKLTEVEQKIISTLISLVEPHDHEFQKVTFSIKEFSKLIGSKGTTSRYVELEKITSVLMAKVHVIKIGKSVKQVQWLSLADYNYYQGTVTLALNYFLKDYLIDLKDEFTSYELKNITKLKSNYAIRIYELLRQYYRTKNKERIFLLDDLREKIGVNNAYPNYGNFKQRVLLPAQKQINNKSDLMFEFEEIYVGRSVKKIKFTFKKKTPLIPIEMEVENDITEDIFEQQELQFLEENKLSSELIAIKKLLMSYKLNVADQLIEKWSVHGIDRIQTELNYINENKSITNPIGFLNHRLTLEIEKPTIKINNVDIKEIAINKFINSEKYSKATRVEIVPLWLMRENAIKSFEKSMTSDEAISLWEDKKEEIHSKIYEQFKV